MTAGVWFKRDPRVSDHAPLAAATASGEPVVGLFVIESAWLASAEFDVQHAAFTLQALAVLRGQLAGRGLPLLVKVGGPVEVLQALHRAIGITRLVSLEETGPGRTWDRDRAVAAWCRAQGLRWQEWPQTGVVRRLKSRGGWAARWQRRMDAAIVPAPAAWHAATVDVDDLPTLQSLGLDTAPRPLPAAGEAAAQAVLHDFLHERGGDYRRALSSPLSAEQGCSRLSAHLAFGTISLRQVHQTTEARIAAARASADAAERRFAHALRGFAGRLRWHCHFMQKLEDEPAIEFHNFSRVCDGLRGQDFDRERFEAWCAGRTGIKALRIYSPARQARDHDPQGHFVRRWVPESGTPAYPAPIVDERTALAAAKERLYGLRRGTAARAGADAIQQRHGSRRSGLPPSGAPRRRAARPAAPVQAELFADLSTGLDAGT